MIINCQEAIRILKSGNVIGVPTDTVYGFCVLPEYADKIYEIKQRSEEKKLITMIFDIEKLNIEDENIKSKMKEVWPGETTLIFEIEKELKSFRVPNEKNMLELLEEIGEVYVTSANISGEDPIVSQEEFIEKFPNIHLLDEKHFSSKTKKPSEILIYEENNWRKLR